MSNTFSKLKFLKKRTKILILNYIDYINNNNN